MLNLVQVQDQIIAHLKNSVPQEVKEQAIEDNQTVKKVNGEVVPYIALQFGTLNPKSRGKTFVGVRTFDYDVSIQVQVIAANPTLARKIMFDNVYNALVGFKLPWTGEIEPDRVGGVFPIVTSNAATEAYQYASGFRMTLQMNDV